MYVIRDVFRCKPGKSRQLADMFKKSIDAMKAKGVDGMGNPRIMVDFVTDYWRVVMESEVESLAKYEEQMVAYSSNKEMRDSMAGYMDLVLEGHREMYKMV